MRHSLFGWAARCGVLVVAVSSVVLPGCAPTMSGSPSATATAAVSLSAVPSASAGASQGLASRPKLPVDFPVPPGAETTTLPDDPTVIGRWTYKKAGSDAFNFYVGALPRAGCTILGQFPGGGGGVIRFQLPDGRVWQVVTEPDGDRTRITVQTDRP
jgi:hypothetical protein